MVVLHVTVQVKPEYVSQFLEQVRHDAEHSEKDEPGCLRFDVIQDRTTPIGFITTRFTATRPPWRRIGRPLISDIMQRRSNPGSLLRPNVASARM